MKLVFPVFFSISARATLVQWAVIQRATLSFRLSVWNWVTLFAWFGLTFFLLLCLEIFGIWGCIFLTRRFFILRPVSWPMSFLFKHQIRRLERPIELSLDWLEIQYLMAEFYQLKDLYKEQDAEAAWSSVCFQELFLFIVCW